MDYIKPLSNEPYALAENKYIDSNQYNSKSSDYYSTKHSIEIKHGEFLEQEFLSTEETITGFRIQFAFESIKEKNGNILIQIKDKDNQQTVADFIFDIRDLADKRGAILDVPVEITGAMNKCYVIVLTPSLQEGGTICLYRSLYDSVYGEMTYMGEEQEGDIVFAVYSGDLSDIKIIYLIFVIVFLFGILFLISFLWTNHQNTARCVAAIVLIVGIMYSMILPSSTLPDENRHIRWAYANSSWMLGEVGISDEDTILMREGDLWLLSENRYPDANTYVREYKGLFRTDSSEAQIDTGQGSAADSIGVAYLPQALGMAIARFFDMGSIPMLMIGKILGLLLYTVLIYWAVRLMPFAKMLVGISSILPMTIWLGTGYSYDMLSIGSVYLFIAYVFHLAYAEEGKANWKDWLKLSVLLAVLASMKVVYLGVGFLAVLIPYRRNKKNWKSYIGVLCTWVSGFGGVLLVKMYLILRVLKIGQEANALQESVKYYPSYFLAHPLRLLRVLFNTPIRKGDEYLAGIIGKMGWLNINISTIAFVGFGIILFMCVCYYGKETENYIAHRTERVIIGIAAITPVPLVMITMLFADTERELSYIQGIQGRYFLPLIPLFLILIKNKISIAHQTMNRCVFQTTVILHVIVILDVFAEILNM